MGTILAADTSPEETTPSRLLKISPLSKIPRKHSTEKIATPFFFITAEANNVLVRLKKQRGNKVKEQRNREYKQPQYVRSRKSENAEKKV